MKKSDYLLDHASICKREYGTYDPTCARCIQVTTGEMPPIALGVFATTASAPAFDQSRLITFAELELLASSVDAKLIDRGNNHVWFRDYPEMDFARAAVILQHIRQTEMAQ